jgi:RNA polymerase sigma-70 factor (ECF subfamily)
MSDPVPQRARADLIGEEAVGELVAAATESPEAFAPLYYRYVAPVYRYILNRTGNQSEAEDLTSQVFLSALEGLAGYNHRGRLAAWLFGIARFKVADHFRASRRELPLEAANAESTDPDPLTQVIEVEDAQRVARAFRLLVEEDQELIRLRFVAELSFADIGEIVGCSEGAAKKRLTRLLARPLRPHGHTVRCPSG